MVPLKAELWHIKLKHMPKCLQDWGLKNGVFTSYYPFDGFIPL